MEFIRGQKLASLPRAEIRALVDVGQNAFLVQLLDVGYLHADPHPGNLMKVAPAGKPRAGCLLWRACSPGHLSIVGVPDYCHAHCCTSDELMHMRATRRLIQ